MASKSPDQLSYPPMKMYFHTGTFEFILFRELVPRTTGAYIGYVILILLMGVVCELLGVIRFVMDMRDTRIKCAPRGDLTPSTRGGEDGCCPPLANLMETEALLGGE